MSENMGELGRVSHYDMNYNPQRLCVIPRAKHRRLIQVHESALPFVGYDVWHHYEVSWLNARGKPLVAMARIAYDCTSPVIVESKSLKLYFNSLNETKFNSVDELTAVIKKDLESCLQTPVKLWMAELKNCAPEVLAVHCAGESIDDLDIDCTLYTVHPDFLSVEKHEVEETLTSDLLKSNCLVTRQPDWGSVCIAYRGKKINREGLLKYIVSFRRHDEFHEQCIERIFMDILQRCQPHELAVYGRYTRRGGLDINPCRATSLSYLREDVIRLLRQ